MTHLPEYDSLNLPAIGNEILKKWQDENTFEKSVKIRKGSKPFTFYEGPPSANGMPGIHHVMARSIKDIFCRYKTMKGYQVKRKGGWDTHGLPIELGVEKMLGITKDDIGKKISIEDYNAACRREVMKYKDKWEDLTRKMGYWVDMEHPYVTFDNNYIESVWHLLKELYKKGLLYKGYTIQPYSWAAGTGLSSHELNQPGCYKNIKDNTVTVQFKVVQDKKTEKMFPKGDIFFLAWTTTPWTLPSNCALAVGKNIEYALVKTLNRYSGKPVRVILARELLPKYFDEYFDEYDDEKLNSDTAIIEKNFKGSEFEGIRYEQLMPYAKPEGGDAFRVLLGDFVTTEDGTGIVHIAPSFGADDFRVAKQNGIGSLTLVDRNGKFTAAVTDFAGRQVKTKEDQAKQDNSTDLAIILKLKKEEKAFKIEKYEHNYPHCWRTDEPVIYYPLDSWFVKTTAVKERMIELNKTINWKPEATGTGRFGNWLENLVDWNLSRSRFWGIPLPVWRTEDSSEEICIGSVAELEKEISKSAAAGFMKQVKVTDLHRPYMDEIVLVSTKGKKMFREPDLIDVWFDSGAMPYAQWHYPFENKEAFGNSFPADFIAEGVDQTRGWFFTLHAIACMLFDSVAYKNVLSNGLVLDKHGNKMSKRLGNAVDPFEVIEKYGPDAVRWYLISNAQPWDNLKFDREGIAEVQRKFFRALYNTYSFFALYANIDRIDFDEKQIPLAERTELDRWILSALNSLMMKVEGYYNDYEPMRAAREIENFVVAQLSNWYVRLSRRRFWRGGNSSDKIAAYQTLFACLDAMARMIAPIAPFYADRLYCDLQNTRKGGAKVESVHLSRFPSATEENINPDLEELMATAQKICSLTLGLRKKYNLPVRQPLKRILMPVSSTPEINSKAIAGLEKIKKLVLAEVNVKELEIITDTSGVLIKKIKPNFKELGKKLGSLMKEASGMIQGFNQQQIREMEQNLEYKVNLAGKEIVLTINDVEIVSEDIPGWHIATEGSTMVALDVTVTKELKDEGIARELVSRIQNMRKERNFEVTDKIVLKIVKNSGVESAIVNNFQYICAETLAESLELVESIDEISAESVEVDDNIHTSIIINKLNLT
ncbi:MAG: isoleucine--tRNA ligase [Bacteroidia bacterium]|nr:isoleucine--tRNA ligase [Bacteroidia bacterium]